MRKGAGRKEDKTDGEKQWRGRKRDQAQKRSKKASRELTGRKKGSRGEEGRREHGKTVKEKRKVKRKSDVLPPSV